MPSDSICFRKSPDPLLSGITSSSASTLLCTMFCLAIICTPDNCKFSVLLCRYASGFVMVQVRQCVLFGLAAIAVSSVINQTLMACMMHDLAIFNQLNTRYKMINASPCNAVTSDVSVCMHFCPWKGFQAVQARRFQKR